MEQAPFVVVWAEEAPAAWRNVPEGSHLAIELPDIAVSWAYLKWHSQQADDGIVGVVVSAREQWVDRPGLMAAVFHSLRQTGRPFPVWVHISQPPAHRDGPGPHT